MAERQQGSRPVLLVLASTYPRWQGDPEPGFVHELAKRCTGEFDVIALVPNAPGALARERLDGVEVVRYRYAPRWLETLVNDGGIVTNLRRRPWKLLMVPGFVLAQFFYAQRLVRARQVDVIHAHWLLPQGLIAAVLQRKGQRVPYLVTSHGADLYALRAGWMERLKRMVVQRASLTTVVSRPMCMELERIGADAAKIAVRSMGVDLTARFRPDTVPRKSCEILFVGRLVEKKGVSILLRAMPAVLAAVPQATLVIAGFGPQEAMLKEQVRRLGLEQCVHFLGPVTQADLPNLYRGAAVLAAPFVRAASGDQEGLGLVTAEAIGCGCPVVTSDLPATLDVMSDRPGFLRVKAGDVPALATAIVAVITQSERHRQGALDCRQQLLEVLDWSAVSADYVRMLKGAIDDTPR